MSETKTKKPKKRFDPTLIQVALGFMLMFLSVIVVLNTGYVVTYIVYFSAFVFGVFYYFVYIFLFFLGAYLVFKHRFFKCKIGMIFWGIILILIAILMAITQGLSDSSNPILLNNCVDKLIKALPGFNDVANQRVDIFGADAQVGGGLLGYFLCAIFNSTLTPIGTAIIIAFIMIGGLALIIIRPIIKYVNSTRSSFKNVAKKEIALASETSNQNEETNEEITSIDTSLNASSEDNNITNSSTSLETDSNVLIYPSFDNLNITTPATGFSKAHFVREGSISPKNNPTIIDNKTDAISARKDSVYPLDNEEKFEQSTIDFTGKSNINEELATVKTTFAEPIVKKVSNTQTIKEEVKEEKTQKIKPKLTYKLPDHNLLSEYESSKDDIYNEEVCVERTEVINKTMSDLGVGAQVVGHTMGPSVTRYDVLPNANVSVSSIDRIVDDISSRLGGVPARFESVVRGKTTAGLEIPNAKTAIVGFKEVFDELPSIKDEPLAIPFGKDISGNVISAPLDEFPHMLISGTTGSGKSIFVHSVLMSLIMRTRPDELRFIIIDPKRVEMTKYRDMPHLLCPIVTDASKANVAMNRLVSEMEKRYSLFEETMQSKISQYNEYAEENNLQKLPYIIVVVDEYADLVESCKDIAQPIVRIAQKARAAGIHLIISTQRPSTNVITGTIKANLPTRVALMSSSAQDSITILGQGGAEQLLGYGDMLVDCTLISRQGFTRVQGAFVSNKEIVAVVSYLKEVCPTDYNPEFLDLVDRSNQSGANGYGLNHHDDNALDERYEQIKQIIMTKEYTSISQIQREFGVGFSRAGKIFMQLQRNGIVDTTPVSSSRGCRVLVREESPEVDDTVTSGEQSYYEGN